MGKKKTGGGKGDERCGTKKEAHAEKGIKVYRADAAEKISGKKLKCRKKGQPIYIAGQGKCDLLKSIWAGAGETIGNIT